METTDCMSANEIKNAIKGLALCQGFYGRLYDNIESSEDPWGIYEELAAENFKTPVDLAMYFEC